jgi:hypothetical protein
LVVVVAAAAAMTMMRQVFDCVRARYEFSDISHQPSSPLQIFPYHRALSKKKRQFLLQAGLLPMIFQRRSRFCLPATSCCR